MEHTTPSRDASRAIAPPALYVDPAAMEPLTRGEGIVTTPYVGSWNSDLANVMSGVTRIAPGGALPLHSHNVEESMLVIEGEATAEVGDGAVDLHPGQLAWVPADTPHRLVNRGSGELAVFWVYGGRDVTRTLTETGETSPQLTVDGTGTRR